MRDLVVVAEDRTHPRWYFSFSCLQSAHNYHKYISAHLRELLRFSGDVLSSGAILSTHSAA